MSVALRTLSTYHSTLLTATSSVALPAALVVEAMLASDALREKGVAARVLNMHTVKPLDTVALKQAAKETPAMIVVEEHSIIGGLGAAVLEALAEVPHGPVRRIGIADVFPPIGPPHALRASLGLGAENILAQALDMVRTA